MNTVKPTSVRKIDAAAKSMNTLHLGGGVTLPLDAVTQTFGIVAVRGVGKTHTASVLAEELLDTGHQVVIIDPLDAWWGLRSAADGGPSGLAVYVFGGDHADLPLDGAAGKLMADVVVEQGISCVLSLRHLSKTAQRRFVADFAERIYHRKGETKYRTPLQLIVDEADAFAPQRVMADTARVMGAIDDCVRRGRNVGFGVTLITQRPATLNKDVLAMIDILIALRTVSPQDRKALDEWVKAHDTSGRRDEFMASLAGLARGEAWIWSPAWLDLFVRVQIRQRRTFDSSATPKAGEKAREPARLQSVDLDVIASKMQSVVVEAEANDPRKLKATVAELTRKLAQVQASNVTCEHEKEIAELQARIRIEVAAREQFRALHADAAARIETICNVLEIPYSATKTPATPSLVPLSDEVKLAMRSALENLTTTPRLIVHIADDGSPGDHVRELRRDARPAAPPVTSATPPQLTTSEPTLDGITGGAMRMLLRLAERHPETWTRSQLATLAKVKKSGGTFGTYFSRLLNRGLIAEENGRVSITDAGLAAVGGPPAQPESVVDLWRAKLTGGARRMFDVLIEAGPSGITRGDLAIRAEIAQSGGTFGTYLSRLMTNGLVEEPEKGLIVATDLLLREVA